MPDPLPPGQSCPCNPSQNGLVNPEYDAAVKVAIEAGVADGIHYFLAAGNGCVNLDHATFGTTFRNSTDTGSNYVSAINSTGDHDASCFTNWGERCDLNAWGDGSFTLGYGNDGDPGFTPTSANEWYTSSFSGTSNASPTVAGCAGVVHNIYRNYYGTTISTSLMRSYLNDFGTAPGNVTPGNIGVMPNLQGILAPDMNPDQRTGWSSPMVPRTTNDATGDDCILSSTLNPAPSTTYWNASIENDRPLGWATPAKYRVYIDDAFVAGWQESDDTLSPLERTYGINAGVATRGGRHFARLTADPLAEVDEWDENDNSWYGHYVWNGRQLANGSVLTLSQPPIDFVTDQVSEGFVNPNCDGYNGTQFQNDGWWDILMVMAETSTADYDARVYSEAITSTNGFDTYEQQSSYITFSDFVGVNANVLGQSVELLGSVVNMDDGRRIIASKPGPRRFSRHRASAAQTTAASR
ncbi:MAG: S8 family serine peptidase [bacterium]|nr:S8 family serine peptidase [bacterium]